MGLGARAVEVLQERAMEVPLAAHQDPEKSRRLTRSRRSCQICQILNRKWWWFGTYIAGVGARSGGGKDSCQAFGAFTHLQAFWLDRVRASFLFYIVRIVGGQLDTLLLESD